MAQKPEIEIAKLTLDGSIVRWRAVSNICLTAIRWGGTVAIAFYVFKTVDCLAGRTTAANMTGSINLRFLANRYAAEIVFAIFGAGGIGYGVRAKSLYNKATKKLKRLEKYERNHDPDRSGTGMTDDE